MLSVDSSVTPDQAPPQQRQVFVQYAVGNVGKSIRQKPAQAKQLQLLSRFLTAAYLAQIVELALGEGFGGNFSRS